MSENIYESEKLYLTEMVGPASEGPDRRRWQLTTSVMTGYAVLDADELHDLLVVATASLARRGGLRGALRPSEVKL